MAKCNKAGVNGCKEDCPHRNPHIAYHCSKTLWCEYINANCTCIDENSEKGKIYFKILENKF